MLCDAKTEQKTKKPIIKQLKYVYCVQMLASYAWLYEAMKYDRRNGIKNAKRVCEREKMEYYFTFFLRHTLHSLNIFSFVLLRSAFMQLNPLLVHSYIRVHVMERNEIKWTRTLVCSAFTFSIFHFHNVWVRYLCQRASSRLVCYDLS